jgi:hypothetical protein
MTESARRSVLGQSPGPNPVGEKENRQGVKPRNGEHFDALPSKCSAWITSLSWTVWLSWRTAIWVSWRGGDRWGVGESSLHITAIMAA